MYYFLQVCSIVQIEILLTSRFYNKKKTSIITEIIDEVEKAIVEEEKCG